jgi:hypothetical protein
MIIDFESGHVPYAQIFDANGLEWTDVYICDTKQGIMLRQVYGTDGLLPLLRNGHFVKEFVKTAAPLRVVFADPSFVPED